MAKIPHAATLSLSFFFVIYCYYFVFYYCCRLLLKFIHFRDSLFPSFLPLCSAFFLFKVILARSITIILTLSIATPIFFKQFLLSFSLLFLFLSHCLFFCLTRLVLCFPPSRFLIFSFSLLSFPLLLHAYPWKTHKSQPPICKWIKMTQIPRLSITSTSTSRRLTASLWQQLPDLRRRQGSHV